jgi:hypothetical protein
MAESEADRAQADEAVPHVAFDSEDLAFFQEVIDDVLDDLLESGDYPLAAKNREELRHRLAMAVFQCAEVGERDATSLRRRVLEIFFAPSSSRPAA